MGDLLQQCEKKIGQMVLKAKETRSRWLLVNIYGLDKRPQSVQARHIFGQYFDILIGQLLGHVPHHAVWIIVTSGSPEGGELSLDVGRVLAGEAWILGLLDPGTTRTMTGGTGSQTAAHVAPM